MAFEHPVAVTKPTLKAEGHFEATANLATVGITTRGLEPHNLAYILYETAAGLRDLAVGLRATYILLDKCSARFARQPASRQG